ncbi:hypothetical protein ABPG75_003406 [Micractinium tetrahymenae]
MASQSSVPYGPCQAEGPLPKLPGWKLNFDAYENGCDSETAQDYLRNVAAVAAANETKARLDVVVLGDSLTAHAASLYPDAWDEAFEGLDALPLGVYGNSIHELAWQLLFGGLKLAVAPRVVVVFVGINDLQYGRTAEQAAERLDWLLSWLAATWPTSDFLLQALLPHAELDVGPANEELAALAAEHGAGFSTCGADLDPSDAQQYTDKVHLAEEGYRRFLPCLRAEAEALLAADRCGAGGAPGPAPSASASTSERSFVGGPGEQAGAEVAAAPATEWQGS